MNSTRSATVPSRPPTQYDESLFQMMGKSYNDSTPRSNIPTSSSTTPQITQNTTTTDQYTQIRQTQQHNSSAVFDPSEFPTLGGAISSNNMAINSSSLMNNSSSLDSSSLSNPQSSNPSMNGLGQYAEHYNVSTFRDNRTKAVDALTASSNQTEFNMQNEDFPALGGNPAVSSMRTTSVLASTFSNNNPPNGTITEKSNGPDLFYERNNAIPQPQPQVVLGRGKARSDQSYHPIPNYVANGLQVPDSRQPQQSIDRTNVLSYPYGQRQKQADLNTSPSKMIPSNPTVNSIMVNRIIPSTSINNNSIDPIQNEIGRTPTEVDRVITKGIENGNSITSESYSNGLARKYPPDMQDDSKNLMISKKPEDRLKLSGLIPIVHSLLSGSARNILSVGLDLTALGLDLNSVEPLHKTFENPWDGGQSTTGSQDQPNQSTRNHEPDYKLPSCYYMQPPALKMSHFTKFQLETLFYIFYNMPKDVLQIFAAEELYNKKWMYHKDLKLWFTCNAEAMQGYEGAGYVYFDLRSWEKRPFPDANQSFIQGLMKEEELKEFKVPSH